MPREIESGRARERGEKGRDRWGTEMGQRPGQLFLLGLQLTILGSFFPRSQPSFPSAPCHHLILGSAKK